MIAAEVAAGPAVTETLESESRSRAVSLDAMPASAPLPDTLSALFRVVPQALLELDAGGLIVRANPAAMRLFDTEALVGKHWIEDCVAAIDRDAEATVLREVTAAGTSSGQPRRVRVISQTGTPRELMIRTAAVEGDDGRAVGTMSWADDVSDDQSSQQDSIRATLAELETYKFAIDASAIVAITDRRGIIRHVNEQFCAISRYSADELLGRDHQMVNSGYHSSGFFKEMWQTIGRGRVWRGDIRNRAKDGTIYWVATTIVPFLDEDERPQQYIAIRFEITERKLAETALERTVRDLAVAREEEARRAEALRDARDRLEVANRRIREEQAKLIQAEKLSSIGMLASGVAHEINNPLAGVMNCVKALSAGTAKASRRDEYFRTAQDGLDRIQQIVRGLLDYARQRPLASTDVDVDEVLSACERLIAPYLRRNKVELVNRIDAPLVLLADRSRLMQALINILLNAIYVSPENSVVEVCTESDGGRVAIGVRDHGPGMPEDVIKRACDPFFTTKPEGEGTGLGLAVTASIVRAHGGDIEFRVHGQSGDPDPGTTVFIWLPDSGEQGATGA